jgi:DNA-binding transcriptional MerR regulator/uncharacterized protein (DUF433 family)
LIQFPACGKILEMASTQPVAAPKSDLWRGVYDSHRAAALSGVPERTLTRWAATGLFPPSISPEPRTRYWSWFDLLALRTIDWLRKLPDDVRLRRVTIPKIRQALEDLEARGLARARLHDTVVRTHSGDLFFEIGDALVRADPSRQGAMPGVLPLVRPYKSGPDLLEPRPLIRIIPGKLHGEPHLLDSRIPTAAIFALNRQGFSVPEIARMYPDADQRALGQAIELEESLSSAA